MSVAGGGVIVALKSEKNKIKKEKNSKLTFKVKKTIRCRFGMMGKHRVAKEQS